MQNAIKNNSYQPAKYLKCHKSLLLALLFFLIQTNLFAVSFENNTPPDVLRDFNILKAKLKHEPRNVSTLNSLGILYAKANNLEEAIKIWQYALNINPRYIHLYNNLGSAYKQLGLRGNAELIFKAGLAITPSYWIYYNLGLLEKEDGRYAEAVESFRNCLKHYPNFEPALKKLEEMGYQRPLPRMVSNTRMISLGNYKPPVMLGNIDLQPLYPKGYNTQKKDFKKNKKKWHKQKIPYPEPPLTLASCTEIIANFKAPEADKYVALTFDDGPHLTRTPEILDILKKEKIHATFFVIGNRAKTYPDIVTREANEGNEVGNHTWAHKSLTKQSRVNALRDLKKTSELISALTHKPCNFVRPPYGHTNKSVKNLLHSQGWYQVMWDSDSRDWEDKNPQHILWRVMNSIKPGCIILFHDIHPGAAKALPTIIKAYKANGYKFVTMSEMLKRANSQI